MRAYILEHKERYDIIIGEEWYVFVIQQAPRHFLPRHLFSTIHSCFLYFTLLLLLIRVTFVVKGESRMTKHMVV